MRPTTLLLGALPVGVLGGNILSTSGFSTCQADGTVKVNRLNVSYNKDTRIVDFDVDGVSTVSQNVTATIYVSAYGKQVYTNSFNPCDKGITQLCPVPATPFSAHGQETIPSQYADQIPSIAFSIPDLEGNVRLELKSSNGTNVACLDSTVGNGKTLAVPAVSYAAAGVAAAALVMSGVSAIAAGGHPGASHSSPGFVDVMSWFQSMSLNGMLSVSYPPVYRQFTTNFAFSTGLIPWGQMQNTIDNFRASTGGNLTENNYPWLKNNATLVYEQNTNSTNSTNMRRALDYVVFYARDGSSLNLNGTSISAGNDASNSTTSNNKQNHFVSGIDAYVEQLTVPRGNTFMTVLLIWCIVVAAIIVLILLFKVILEAFATCSSLPKSLESWRKRYWWRMAKALVSLTLLLYGSWVLYCVYQFTNGDSWAAQVLAGVTLGLFTVVLFGFAFRIWSKARQFKQAEGDAHRLYEDKETWVKYSLFYDSYKKQYWWLFIPTIVYLIARGSIIAGASGHGLTQTAGQLIVEGLMLGLLLWTRPFNRPSSMWINIIVQAVRVLSVVCILVFVEELGIAQTTKTITGVVLIVVQCVLTGVLAILIAVNGIIACVRENPHRRARKDAEKRNREFDNLTPLDARNSLLMEPMRQGDVHSSMHKVPMISTAYGEERGRYGPVSPRPVSPDGTHRSFSRPLRPREDDNSHLMSYPAPMGRYRDDSPGVSRSPPPYGRQPRLPSLDLGHAR